MSIIELKNVTYHYYGNPEPAVNNVSLNINEGEFIVILGKNGSGKSTLAKLLNGLFQPKNGDVVVFSNNTKDEKRIYDIRANVGMVFQNPDNQMIASIIEDDIAFGPENLGIPREEIIERVNWALKAVDMDEFRYSTPFKMSGGQKQRISIAAMLAMKPKILVLDESTAMLDPIGRKNVMNVIKKLNKEEKITIIHITHYMDEAVDADRVIIMDNGEIVCDDTPLNLFTLNRNVEQYGIKLPVVAQISKCLKEKNLPINITLNVDTLVEEICRLMQ